MTLTFVLFALYSCSSETNIDPLEQIKDLEVKRVLEKGFAASGGLDTYGNIDSIVFQKKTILYLQDGAIESEVIQEHRYSISPSLSGEITWQDSIGDHKLVFEDDQGQKYVNGKLLPTESEKAKKSFFSNYYVLLLPFKLLDEGTQLSYDGKKKLPGGGTADVIKATYDPGSNKNHSTSDDWYLFFDEKSGHVLGNLVYHAPTYAFIENKNTTDEHPLRMNLYRQTWRTDKELNKEYLRGEFWYSNYHFTKK